MGFLERMRRLFGGSRDAGPAPRPAASVADGDSPRHHAEREVSVLVTRPVFSSDVTQQLIQRIRGLMREVSGPGDKLLLSTLLRAVKNDGVDLPAMPKEMVAIQGMLNQPEVDVPKLAQAIQREPIIAGKFLAVSNSPFYSRGYKVVSAQQAIVRLGLTNTRLLVTAILARSKVFHVAEYQEEANRLYTHALGSASVAQLLARLDGRSEEDAFMAGLFHDLGQIFVLTTAGNIKANPKNDVAPTPDLVAKAALQLDEGFSALVAESWGYGPDVVFALENHHRPGPMNGEEVVAFPEDEERLTYLLAAADQMAYGFTDPEDPRCDAARQILDALDLNLTPELMAMAKETADAFAAEVGLQSAA